MLFRVWLSGQFCAIAALESQLIEDEPHVQAGFNAYEQRVTTRSSADELAALMEFGDKQIIAVGLLTCRAVVAENSGFDSMPSTYSPQLL